MIHHDPRVLAHTKELVESIRTCMMTSLTPEGRLLSRPMTALEMDGHGMIWFFASEESEQTVSFDMDESVNLAFASPETSKYLSIAGSAKVTKDPEKIAALWNPLAAAWFPDGKEDPLLCLIEVRPISAEYWDSPSSRVTQLFGIARAILRGERYASGTEHERVDCGPNDF